MKRIHIISTVLTVGLFIAVGCNDKEGCKDINATNYDSAAEKNIDCKYRYASTIDVSGVQDKNPNGDNWDGDGSGPDLKLNFGKGSNANFDFTTNTISNGLSGSLTPSRSIQFTNETWKYELIDEDLIGSPEVIATGTFNPIALSGSNSFTLTNGTVNLKFNFTTN
jgi:hypothetical protein